MPVPHQRGLAAQDSLGLFATEGTPYTAATFASADYLVMDSRPVFEPINSPDDLGLLVGGFDRAGILPGSLYGRIRGSGLLRRAADVDDGPEAPYMALLLGAGYLNTVSGSTSSSFALDNSPVVWEANRYTARVDHHGDQKTIFGCLTENLTYTYTPGMAVRYAFSCVGLVSGTYATHRPAEANPVSRTPAVSFGAANVLPPFVFQGATISYTGSTALSVRGLTISIDTTVTPVLAGNGVFGVDGVLLVDRVINASLTVLRPLQATKKLDEEYQWLQNNGLAGANLVVTLSSGSRTLVQTLNATHQTSFPVESVQEGLNMVTLNLRGTASFTHLYT